ncbi:MAG: 4-hydroxy-tetrahydrodipicolinate reductase [Clostridia bacterium]|nr:4-hydroxy-tetrahydrodipicolinate reductase [Clostridia bacterium]
MRILINGILGHMGREVEKLALAGYRGAALALGVDIGADGSSDTVYPSFDAVSAPSQIDCIVDFSHHSAVCDMLDFATKNSIPTVVATTGHTEEEKACIIRASEKIPVFYSGNMSLGIALLIELAKITALAMPEAEIEIIESHHNRKLDAPSGTALMIADAIHDVRPSSYNNVGRGGHGKRTPDEIGIHSVRMGNIVGIHEVIVGTANQTITLKHEAHDRALFAEGALAAAAFIVGREAALYDMSSLVDNTSHTEN